MKINVIRGYNQIGGNIIELSTDSTHILLDIGLELDSHEQKPPDFDGLCDVTQYDAVFISHYHSDHIGLAYYIDRKIPLYIGEASYRIVKAADDYKGIASIQPFGFLSDQIPIIVGNIKITPFLCDHSAFDSYMLLCEANGKSALYTGDFRSNGRKSFQSLLKKLPQKVDTLICEGTTLSRKNHVAVTERELEDQAANLFNKTNGPVFILQSAMNIDRIVTMYRAAKRSNRIFLEEVYMADIAVAAGNNIPNPTFNDVFAFITSPSKYRQLEKYERKIGKASIPKMPFVMGVRNSMLHYLKSLANEMSFESGILVYSFWEGYREKENMKLFLKECEKLGLRIVTLHTSGHADENTIRQLIKTVNPDTLIPVHTENAQRFKELAPKVIY